MIFKKYFVAISLIAIAGFLFFNFAVSDAKAATVEELRVQIEQLQSLIVQLQRQLAQIETGDTAPWCHTFNVNLRYGDGTGIDASKEDEVRNLHIALENEGFQINDNEQKGGASFEASTASAVVGFQQKYKSEVLAPWGLANGTGYVGNTTRVKLNQLYGCTATPVPTTPSISYVSPNSGAVNDTIIIYGKNLVDAIPDGATIEFLRNGVVRGTLGSQHIHSSDGSLLNFQLSGLLVENMETGIYQIRVVNNNGKSNAVDFTILGSTATPSITLLSPNGGEQWVVGNTYQIKWKFSGTGGDVYISLDKWASDGSSVSGGSIISRISATAGTYSWTIPQNQEASYYYKINMGLLDVTQKGAGGVSDTSDNYFSIAAAITAPSITVLSPNGGEQWQVGKTYNITWQASRIETVMIEIYDSVNAEGWHLAYNVPANLEKYSWTVPATIGAGSDYKINIWDPTNASIIDSSDNYFSIASASPVACTDSDIGKAGTGKNYYTKGTVADSSTSQSTGITYTDYCVNDSTLREYFCSISSLFPNGTAGQEDYVCPYGCQSGACVSQATDSDNSPDYLSNPIYSTITPERYPDLFVKGVGKGNYLGGGPCLYGTESNPTYCKSTSDNYTTYYDHCATATQLNEAHISNGKLGAVGVNCPYGCQDGACVQATVLSVTVLSPNGGEQWETGETRVIKWTTAGHSSNSSVQIGLRDGRYDPNLGSGEITIINTTNTGSYNWTIPSTIEAGSFFKIIVYVDGGGQEGKYDLSDNNFQITKSVSQKSLILRPNGAGSECGIPNESGCIPCPSHYTCVDEEITDSSTYVYYPGNTNTWKRDLYSLSDSVNLGIINKVIAYRQVRCNNANSKTSIRTHGAVYDSQAGCSGTPVANNYPFGGQLYPTEWTKNPYTGNPWTWAEINDLEIGVSLLNGNAFNNPDWSDITQLYLKVEYTPELGLGDAKNQLASISDAVSVLLEKMKEIFGQ